MSERHLKIEVVNKPSKYVMVMGKLSSMFETIRRCVQVVFLKAAEQQNIRSRRMKWKSVVLTKK